VTPNDRLECRSFPACDFRDTEKCGKLAAFKPIDKRKHGKHGAFKPVKKNISAFFSKRHNVLAWLRLWQKNKLKKNLLDPSSKKRK